jgi:perosamine synthetase
MIPIARPWLGDEEAEAAAAVVRSGWLSQGTQVAAFEAEFAQFVGAPFACAVSNCTTALHLALLAAEVGPGDEVITVSHSFIATANTIRQTGALPVFVDIGKDTFNMDIQRVAEGITPRTKAILCVHQIGMPCDLAGLMAIARAHKLLVIEDAACAAGSEILLDGVWKTIGAPHGDVAAFSFHPRKVITTGEGGMLTTRHAEWDRKFRLWRQHGMSVPDTVRHGAHQVIFEEYALRGFNYRMTDMQAAIGRLQLGRLPHLVARRRALAADYQRLLAEHHEVVTPMEPTWCRSNWQSYCVSLPSGVDQVKIMQFMLDRGISTRRGIMCSHLEPAYVTETLRHSLPESERARDQCILLPLFAQMTSLELEKVVVTLCDAVDALGQRPAAQRAPHLAAAI